MGIEIDQREIMGRIKLKATITHTNECYWRLKLAILILKLASKVGLFQIEINDKIDGLLIDLDTRRTATEF